MAPLRDALLAFQFLTRVPLPSASSRGADLARSTAWFPLPGIALGLALAGLGRLAGGHLPPAVIAVVLVGLLAWGTGGLHLDGVADVFDGLGGGGGDRARTLAIMRDSRIGAHGATALFLVLAGKIVAVAALAGAGRLAALVGATAVARFAAVPLVAWFPYARPEGLGAGFRDAGPRQVAIALGLVAAVLAALGPGALGPAAAALAAAGILAVTMQRRLGGLTGDVYGAAIELAELVYLVSACAGA